MNLLYAYVDREMVVVDLVHFEQLNSNRNYSRKSERIQNLPSLFIPASRHRPIVFENQESSFSKE